MTAATRLLTTLVATTVVLAAGCTSGREAPDSRGGTDAATPPAPVDPTPRPSQTSNQEDADMRIEINVQGTVLTATLFDNAAVRDLVAQLPLTLSMSDFGSVEKVGELPVALSTAGSPSGADPDIGDLGYYAPWNNLVLYYGDQGYHEGIIRLGTLEGDLDQLARMSGAVTVTIDELVTIEEIS